jgi:NADPH:quinone reductase
MRSIVFQKFGEPADVLAVEEAPLPQPGPGQVRLKLLASPIHNHDLAIIRGLYGYRPPLPAVPGTEAVGVVEQLGPGVDRLAVGQRVTAAGLRAAWAEYFLAPAATVVPVPATIPDDVACQLLAMPLSAHMVLDDLGLVAGDWLIQNAATGAVARAVNAIAAEREINVINLVRRASAVAELTDAGVKHVVSTDDPAWTKQVVALVEGAGEGAKVKAALDSIGGGVANDLMNVLGFGGTLVSFGALSGQPLSINPGNLIFKQAVVKGFWATKRAERTAGVDTIKMTGNVLRLAAEGRLSLPVSAGFALDQIQQAVLAAEKPGRPGKVVLRAG